MRMGYPIDINLVPLDFSFKELSNKIKKFIGHKLCQQHFNEPFFVVLGEYSYYDKKKGYTTTHGPLYVHFADKCLKGVDKENFYGKDDSFPYEKITLHPASKAVMPEHEIRWLSSIGVKV